MEVYGERRLSEALVRKQSEVNDASDLGLFNTAIVEIKSTSTDKS
jgi:hypothetical protein